MFERIVSLEPSSTEILFALGAGKKIVGRTTQCDYPDKVNKIPTVIAKDAKFFVDLKPDLILAQKNTFLEKECKQRDIKLCSFSPQSLQDIYDSIFEIAKLVGKENKADDVVYEIEMRLEKLQKHAPAEQKKIYSEEWYSPQTVAARWVPQLIESAGGISMAEPNNTSYEITLKDLIDFNPDHIVLHWHGFGDKSKLDIVKNRKGWTALRAVFENKIHCIDDALLNRPGPRIWQGAEELQKLMKGK